MDTINDILQMPVELCVTSSGFHFETWTIITINGLIYFKEKIQKGNLKFSLFTNFRSWTAIVWFAFKEDNTIWYSAQHFHIIVLVIWALDITLET